MKFGKSPIHDKEYTVDVIPVFLYLIDILQIHHIFLDQMLQYG